MAYAEQPVANGIRTDHPIPNLPFVDDSHIPIEDPDAVEAVGRHSGTEMWGRTDGNAETGEWIAFTTDPKNDAYAWVVRYHPEHGRSVTLYRDGDAATVHHDWFGERPLLMRLGGYWWDGDTWYRPRQVLSWASEGYMRRPVKLPTTITADDLLDASCDPARGQLRKIMQLEPDTAVPPSQWRHDLALWAHRRAGRVDALPLERCVVTLNAPELAEATLLGVEEFAQEADIAASTLRAYLTRDEADLPAPQVTDGGRRWSRPVVRDWIEQRRREPSNVGSVLTGDVESSISPGLRELWTRLTEVLFTNLWKRPAERRRWSRPHRTEPAVRAVAEQMGWIAALHLDSEVPFTDLDDALRDAVLWQLHRDRENAICGVIAMDRYMGKVLGWFLRHQPRLAPVLFGGIVRDAEQWLEIPPAVTMKSLRRALTLDGGFAEQSKQLTEFLDVALPPEK